MKWLAIKRKDGSVDPYAIGYVSHTVAKVMVMDQPRYEAWRLVAPAVMLGSYPQAKEAQAACERDMRAMLGRETA